MAPPLRHLVRRRQVPDHGNNYEAYRDDLRLDFWYSCAYCTISEIEAKGLGFQIDHHVPDFEGGSSAYGNLMYACQHCNRRKSSIWPNAAIRAMGHRYLRPDEDDFAQHFSFPAADKTPGKIDPVTRPGVYTEKTLGLNRATLKRLRVARETVLGSRQALLLGTRAFLGHGLDTLPPAVRGFALRLKKQAGELARGYSDAVEGLLAEFNHSDVLDPDPEAEKQLKERRAFLKAINALTPTFPTPVPAPPPAAPPAPIPTPAPPPGSGDADDLI